ncbi:unnamed protein product, partial [Phaeothamnion confervicola]
MAHNLCWKHFSKNQIEELERSLEPLQCKRLLGQFLGLGKGGDGLDELEEVVLDFHFYNYAFCKERGFNALKTSTFLSIAKEIFDKDMASSVQSMELSFLRFKELLLTHSVQRPPWSIGVFGAGDVRDVVDYSLTSYFRHFGLYKALFGASVDLSRPSP